MKRFHPRAIALGLCISPGIGMLWAWFELSLRAQQIAQLDPDEPARYLPLGPPWVDWLMTQGVPSFLHLSAILVVVLLSPRSKALNAFIAIALDYLLTSILHFAMIGSFADLSRVGSATLFWGVILNATYLAIALLIDRLAKRSGIKPAGSA